MPLTTPQIVQGLFGNAGNFASLLGGGLPAGVLSLLNPQQTAATAPAAAALASGASGATQPAATLSPMERATQIGDLFNKNAYGTSDPTHLGILASAGFPMFNDTRMVHGYLATMAQNGDDDAMEQLRRMLQGGWSWAGYGAGGEGGGSASGAAGGGADLGGMGGAAGGAGGGQAEIGDAGSGGGWS